MARNLGASLLSIVLLAGCAGSGAPGASSTAQAPGATATATVAPSAAAPTSIPSVPTPAPTTTGHLGSTWRFVADTPRIAAVAAIPSGWVAVGTELTADGRFAKPAAWTSADGARWSEASVPLPDGETYGEMVLVAATPGAIYAAGATSLTGGVVWRSTNGATWQVVGSGPTFDLGPCYEGCARFTSIAASPGAVVLAGYRVLVQPKVGAETDVWVSTDGATWKRIALPGVSSGLRVAGEVSVAATADGFIAAGSRCGSDGTGCRAVTWRSVDGVAWSAPSDLPGGTGATGMKVVRGPSASVVLGERCTTGCLYMAWSSTDGSTWTAADLAGSTVASIWPGLMAVAGTGFLVIGSRIHSVEVWMSDDGRSWNRADLASGSFIQLEELLPMDVAGSADGAIVVGLGPGALGDRESPGVWISP